MRTRILVFIACVAAPGLAFHGPSCALRSPLAPTSLPPSCPRAAHCARSAVTGLSMTANPTEVDDDTRLLGSRRLAAATKVIKAGADQDEASRLLGSKRLRKATSIVLTTPRDRKRMLGSTRLREARMILFSKAAQTNRAAAEEKKLLGSRRLKQVREVLVKGTSEMQASIAPVAPAAPAEPAAATVGAGKQEDGAMAAVAAPMKPVTRQTIDYCGQKPTEKQYEAIATIRGYLAALTADDKELMSPWIDRLEDVDIYRYLLGFGSADKAWEKITATAEWRKAEGIDTILSEDMGNIFEKGKDEMVYLPPDKKGRPILLYRSALHAPGAIDPNTYTRYVIQQTERAIAQYDIGRTTESIVVVDRIGSGLKNQDPALLRLLIPVILNHYPYQVGAVYVAPTSGVFNVIWAVLKQLLTEDARTRFILINKKGLTETLLETIAADVLPSNLGGVLDVGEWLAQRKDLDKAAAQLSELESFMTGEAEEEEGEPGTPFGSVGSSAVRKVLTWAGTEANEEELLTIASIRVNIAELTAAEKADLGPWISKLENEDILRFLRRDKTLQLTWESLQKTSRWRAEHKIDDILSETIDIMPEGGQEFYYTGLDKQQRPVRCPPDTPHTTRQCGAVPVVQHAFSLHSVTATGI